MALEAIPPIGDILVSKNFTTPGGGPEWLVTFMNNAGNVPNLVADSSDMWGSNTVSVGEQRMGTSEPISGSFELRASENTSEGVRILYNSSAAEVKKTQGCW